MAFVHWECVLLCLGSACFCALGLLCLVPNCDLCYCTTRRAIVTTNTTMHTRAIFTEEKVPVRTYVAIIVSFASIVLVFASALDGDGLLGERKPVGAHFLTFHVPSFLRWFISLFCIIIWSLHLRSVKFCTFFPFLLLIFSYNIILCVWGLFLHHPQALF